MIIPGEAITKGHAQMLVRFHLFYYGIVEHNGLWVLVMSLQWYKKSFSFWRRKRD